MMQTKIVLACLATGALALASCSSSPKPNDAAHAKTTTTTSSPTTTSTTSAPTTTSPPNTTPQIPSGFALAKSQWEQGATAISADQAAFWTQAVTDLQGAES